MNTSRSAGPEVVVGYLRVSTEEQGDSGAGLSAQEEAIRSDVLRRRWQLKTVHTDVASGRSRAKRPGLEAALTMVTSGEAGTLMVAKLDRLSRSLLDFSAITAEAHAGGWNLVALDLGVDLSTPAGEFLANVMASAAQWERRIIGQRTSDALKSRKAEGVQLGRPTHTPEELQQRIYQARQLGHSYRRIARDLMRENIPTPQGGQRWYASSVRSVLMHTTPHSLGAT